jgi:antitoxin PrlF
MSTVTDKGQVTLPKPLRDELGIEPGMKVDFQAQPDGSIRLRVRPSGSRGLAGLLARPGERPRSLDELDAGVAAAVAARSRR